MQVLATDTSGAAITAWSATGLPAGLVIASATGLITGTPTSAGSYPVTLTATDSQSLAGSTSFTWAITNSVAVTNPGPRPPSRARP